MAHHRFRGRAAAAVIGAAALAGGAAAQQDPVQQLGAALESNDCDADAAAVAVRNVVSAGAVDALPVLVDGFDRMSELLTTSEIETASSSKEVERLKQAGGDAALLEDRRVTLERAQRASSRQRRVVEAIAAGIPALLDAIAARNQSAPVPRLLAAYEAASKRIFELERREEEQKGRLAQLASRLFELEGSREPGEDAGTVAREKAEAQARVARLAFTLDFHRTTRRSIADVAAKLLRGAKGAEIEPALKQLERRVDGRAPADERVRWIDLYARLGRESVPGELAAVASDCARALKKGEADLAKLRERYDRAKESYFKSIEQGGGTVSVASKNAFQALQKQMLDAAAQARDLERLRGAAARAVGAAVAALAAEARSKATAALLAGVRGEKDLETRCALIESCSDLDELAVREALRRLLVEDREVKARIAALEALVALRDGDAMEIVRARLLAHENWRVRAAAVSALARVPQKASIPALIAALEAESGRVREDITQALQQLTGQRFALSAPVWKKWWDGSRDAFDLDAVDHRPVHAVAAFDPAAEGKVTFYGIRSASRNVCFVLDVSKSMYDPVSGRNDRRKIDVAREQLKQAIAGLADGDQVMIVTFAGSAARWQPKMTTVTTAVKQKLNDWIDQKIELGLGTNIHDGMKEALTVAGLGARDAAYESAIDTIFFLSDGDATVGEVIDPLELRRLIREWNRLSRIRIHTIGVGEEPNVALLYGIAEDSGGQFQKR